MTICLGALMDGITGDWRKQRNEELYKLHSSPDMIFLIGYSMTLLVSITFSVG
jgi:hypothetical protein